jgi:hypothetical protein
MTEFSRGRRHFSAIAATAACVALLTAACTGSPGHPTAGNPPGGPVPQVGPSGSGASASASQSARPTSSASRKRHSSPPATPTSSKSAVAPPVPSCATAGLRGTFGAATGATGTFFYPIQLTNTARSACTLFGYPGVFVVTGPSGSRVGPAATRISTFSPQLVTLAAGGTAHATLQMPNPAQFDPSVCLPKTVHWLRVYPPGRFSPLYVSVPSATNPVQICTGQIGSTIPLGIFVIMPGSTGR